MQTVPVLLSFSQFTFIPWRFGDFMKNNWNPVLVFGNTDFEFRVFSAKKETYGNIERVDIAKGALPTSRHFPFTNSLLLYLKNGIFYHGFNVSSAQALKEALRFLQRKGCPLSEQAKGFLKETGKN